jgi:hypothetical protein
MRPVGERPDANGVDDSATTGFDTLPKLPSRPDSHPSCGTFMSWYSSGCESSGLAAFPIGSTSTGTTVQ